MSDVLTNLSKLPEMCASRQPADNTPILIKRGEMGFYGTPASFDPEGYNKRRGITPAQVKAMEYGSAFGWETPAADPDTWADDEVA